MPIQLKRGYTAQIDKTLVLLEGQPGVEFREGLPPRLKIGDGTNTWRDLKYISPDPEMYDVSGIWTPDNRPFLINATKNFTLISKELSLFEAPRFCFLDSKLDGDEAADTSGWMFINNTGVYTNSTAPLSLGTSTNPWSSVYATTGTIQTSDRKSKENICYLAQNGAEGRSTKSLDIEDVLDLVRHIKPATFCYKHAEDVEPCECETQLGLIADDIAEHKAYDFVGVKNIDDVGETHLGLQPLPLVVAALTTCKHLLEENNQLRAEIAEIKSKLDA